MPKVNCPIIERRDWFHRGTRKLTPQVPLIGGIIPSLTKHSKTSRILSTVSTCPHHPNFLALSIDVAQDQLIVSENCSDAHIPSALPEARGSEVRLSLVLRSAQARWTSGDLAQVGSEKVLVHLPLGPALMGGCVSVVDVQRHWGTYPLGRCGISTTSYAPSPSSFGPRHSMPNHPAITGHAIPHVKSESSTILNLSPPAPSCKTSHSWKYEFSVPELIGMSLSQAAQCPGNSSGRLRYFWIEA